MIRSRLQREHGIGQEGQLGECQAISTQCHNLVSPRHNVTNGCSAPPPSRAVAEPWPRGQQFHTGSGAALESRELGSDTRTRIALAGAKCQGQGRMVVVGPRENNTNPMLWKSCLFQNHDRGRVSKRSAICRRSPRPMCFSQKCFREAADCNLASFGRSLSLSVLFESP